MANQPQKFINYYIFRPRVDIISEDWDNLIILDACRYDAFEKSNFLQGRLEKRVSKGSTSKEFIQENFIGRKLHDTVYITANPYMGLIEPNTFHAIISLLDMWDENVQTVRPDAVANSARSIYEEYSNKRFIIHFMQPHQPYLGAKAREITAEIEAHSNSAGWNNEKRRSYNHGVSGMSGVTHLEAPTYDEIDVSKEDVWIAYLETLKIVLESVEQLLRTLKGKSVITADHGELIGERPYFFSEPRYGHPGGEWTEKLRVVPWFVIESNNRRTIEAETPGRQDSVNREDINSKLRALGYK